MSYQEDFCSLLSSQVQRHGVDKLLEWLAGTGLFPRTRIHPGVPRGLRAGSGDAQPERISGLHYCFYEKA